MISQDLRNRWRFFLEHAGYCSPPGRAACALALAKAEIYANETNIAFAWEGYSDDWKDIKDWEAETGHTVETSEQCLAYRTCDGIGAATNDVVASLGGIWDADDTYRRVIQAELAMEAMEG